MNIDFFTEHQEAEEYMREHNKLYHKQWSEEQEFIDKHLKKLLADEASLPKFRQRLNKEKIS